VRVGGDGDHAGRGARPQPVEEQVGEQERREVVEGEGVLESVGGDMPGVPVPAGVVDQHVDPGEAAEYLVGQAPHLGLGGQVGHERVDLTTGGRAELAGRCLRAPPVAARDRDVRADRGEAESGRPADPAGATRDEHRPAGHRRDVHRCSTGGSRKPLA
jgi:hypothetical protein